MVNVQEEEREGENTNCCIHSCSLFLHFHRKEEGNTLPLSHLTRLWERGEEYIWRDLDFSLPGKCLSGD